ncbi:MAG: tryptophan transporter [Firmicutes bacterium]|nr:tryptophan transporter [Bacillota bacterium]
MKVRDGIQIALLLAIGYILHFITPPLLFGMKPDTLLLMMFIALLLKGKDYKTVLATGLLGGILAAITSTFPGGQLPNIIDKLLTASFAYLLIKTLPKTLPSIVTAEIVTITGTLASGLFFLTAAALIVGLPGSFKALFIAVVIPAAVINAIAIAVLQPVVGLGHQMVTKSVSTVKEEQA